MFSTKRGVVMGAVLVFLAGSSVCVQAGSQEQSGKQADKKAQETGEKTSKSAEEAGEEAIK